MNLRGVLSAAVLGTGGKVDMHLVQDTMALLVFQPRMVS